MEYEEYIIIEGNFTIKGCEAIEKHCKQPLSYLKLKVNVISPLVTLSEFKSVLKIEEEIKIFCLNCGESKIVKLFDWDDGKIFVCDKCNKNRFSKKLIGNIYEK